MPDILIRGMEMPKGCKSCKLSSDSHCNATGQWLFSTDLVRSGFNWKTCRLPDCPLIELPEHGDLIDADSLANDLLYDAELAGRALDDTTLVGKEREYLQSEKDIKQNCAYYVSHSPVIVPASEEVTNDPKP